MTKRRVVLTSLVVASLVVCSTHSLWVMAAGPAGDAVHFLRDGLGPRARGMGGAFTAVCDDLSALFWNPAALVGVTGARLGGSHESRFAGLVSVNYAAVSFALESLGGGALWVSSDIYSVYQLSGAVKLSDAFMIGASCRLYHLGQGMQSAAGVGFDIGVLHYWAIEGVVVTVGLNARDNGWTAIRWDAPGIPAVDHAAWVARLGAAVRFEGELGSWAWSGDVEAALRRPPNPGEQDYLARAMQASVSIGGEAWLGPVALRVGVAHLLSEEGFGTRARPSVGVGVRWGSINLDAAYVHTSPGYTYLVSMEFRLGDGKHETIPH